MDAQELIKRIQSLVPTNPSFRVALAVEGATEDDLASGVAAAIAVFSKANVDPWETAVAYSDLEFPTLEELEEITDETIQLSDVYVKAIDTAVKVACDNLPNTPKKFCFYLLLEKEVITRFGPETREIWYPTTSYGRPVEEFKLPLTGSRQKLVGFNWEWENVKG